MIKSKIKICGIKSINTLNCCIENKVDYFGLIFYKNSPRYIKTDEALNLVQKSKNQNISSVGVFVNEKIDELNNLLKYLKIDNIQLHGSEDNDYIKYIKRKNEIKIIKVISVKNYDDIQKIKDFPNTDIFLFDYKPSNKELPGGNAKTFDWNLIKDINTGKSWFLSGGININNISKINNYANPYGIDISSGVENKPGIKSNEKITSLMKLYESK